MSAILVEAEVETRSGDGYEIAHVDFPKRIVTVVAMPYERPADVFYGDRFVSEVVSRDAFNGIEKRSRKIRANRDHSWNKICGKIVGLHPSRKEGLVTEIQMFKTDLGTETLTLCDEGGLDASAGFTLLRRQDGRVYDDAEVWEQRGTIRRLNRIRLDHVALVPNPAYADATVLDVRKAPEKPQEARTGDEGTPNRDRIVYDAQKAAYDALNARWG